MYSISLTEFESEIEEEDINITIKGDWEKYDCIEKQVIPHAKYKTRENKTTRNCPENFERRRLYELLLDLPDFQFLNENKNWFVK